MPTYTYRCTECGHAFDLFHGINENGTRPCPVCKGESKRLIGGGAGLIFKGSGFYETDYKRKGSSNGDGAVSGAPVHANGNDSAESKTIGSAKTESNGKASTEKSTSTPSKKTESTTA